MLKPIYQLLPLSLAVIASSSQVSAKPDREQLLISPPMIGQKVTCAVLNTTDVTISPSITLFGPEGNPLTVQLQNTPGGAPDTHSIAGGLEYRYCTITWFGQEDDFKASICGGEASGTSPPQGLSCLAID